jgi:ADP-ribose pyrophosphatase
VTDPSDASTERPLADVTDAPEVLETERVFEGRVWDVVRERFAFGDHELVREFTNHPGAVAILARDENDRVLVINQYRHPVGLRIWELPAGLLDVPDEDPLAAAKRELAEEVDLAAEEWTELIEFATSPGGSSETLTVYEARGLSPVPAFLRSEEEAEIEVRWVELDELVEAALDGRLHNSILLIAVLAAHAKRR